MARIYPPTAGTVIARGRVAPMIELGVGFHPDLTGHENIYLNTSLFRLSTRETDAIYDDIVAFSELEQFIDMPVKNYSTGMYARLGFATAIHLAPEILLIDEVLAVGDEHFQKKCLQRMEELRARGTTIVLVTHSMETVKSMCDRACLLLNGRTRHGRTARAGDRALSGGSGDGRRDRVARPPPHACSRAPLDEPPPGVDATPAAGPDAAARRDPEEADQPAPAGPCDCCSRARPRRRRPVRGLARAPPADARALRAGSPPRSPTGAGDPVSAC